MTAELKARNMDGLLVTHPANWFYLTGFTGESGVLLLTPDRTVLVTDGRFTVQAKEETRGVKIELQKGSLYTAVGEFLRKERIGRIGFDPGQLTVAQWSAIRKSAGAGQRSSRQRESSKPCAGGKMQGN